MNDAAPAQDRDNEPLNLGTKYRITLHNFTNESIERFIAALEATSSLTKLSVTFGFYEPTPENNRRIVEPLCRCISNLRRHNRHHPLRDLNLQPTNLDIHGMSDVLEKMLIAAKQCGIRYLLLHESLGLPIQFLVEFCQDNNNLKVLEVKFVSFSDGRAAMSLPPNRPQDSSVMLALDKLSLKRVSFDSISATTFANFCAHMTVRTLVVDMIWASADDDDDLQMAKRILSVIKMPSVEQLELSGFCRIEHFKAALEAGTTSLIELDVVIDDADDYTERLELLANFIRRAVQLSSLTIHHWAVGYRRNTLPRELLRAIEACATITRIRVPNFVHLEQDIATRNEELAHFVASPGTFPIDKLLWLMRQFDNCPTGRYMLARCLPGVVSFEKIKRTDSPTTEPNPKKRKLL